MAAAGRVFSSSSKRRRIEAVSHHLQRQPQQRSCCPPHFLLIGGWCARCGHLVDCAVDEVFLALDYIQKGMKISTHLLEDLRLRTLEESHRLKRLTLVLDLDNTLLHSSRTGAAAAGLLHDPEIGLYRVDAIGGSTKLRPHAREFIRDVSAMYDLYIYTMGSRPYAARMVRLLDPEGVYFGRNVICSEDSTERGRKGLDVVLAHPSTVVVLDDNLAVWGKDRRSVIHAKYYLYGGFDDGDVTGYADATLPRMYNVLKKAHMAFWYGGGGGGRRDVREVLRGVRRGVLRGCRLLFSSWVRRRGCEGQKVKEEGRLRKVAKMMGATCATGMEAEVTHVVVTEWFGWTEVERWGAEEGKFVVTCQWLEDAYYTWERPWEENYASARWSKNRARSHPFGYSGFD